MKYKISARTFWNIYRYQGRAVVTGTIEDPHRWLCQMAGQLFLCTSDGYAIRAVADTVTLNVPRRMAA